MSGIIRKLIMVFAAMTMIFTLSCMDMYTDLEDELKGYNYFLAVAGNSSVYTFSLSSDGSLVLVGQYAVGSYASEKYIAVHPSGKYLYAGDTSTTNILMYSISEKGELSPLSTPSIDCEFKPGQIKINPNGEYLFVVNNKDTLKQYTIDQDGVLAFKKTITTKNDTYSYKQRIEINSSGEYLYILTSGQAGMSSSSQYIDRYDTSTLDNQIFTSFPSGTTATSWDIVVHPNNNYVYAAYNGGVRIYDKNLNFISTYSITVLNSIMVIPPGGKYLYCSNDSTVQIFNIQSDGSLTSGSSLSGSSTSFVEGVVSPYANCMFISIHGPSSARIDKYILNKNGLAVSQTSFYTGTVDDLYGLTLFRQKK